VSDMPRPAVSVIIPGYGNAEFVNQAVQSVYDQTFTDWELIVVDDCSPAGVADAYHVGDRGRLILHPARCGPAGARNTGIREARGRYIALLDMDDIWLPQKLETQVREMEQRSCVGMSYCHHTLVDQQLMPLARQPVAEVPEPDLFKRLMRGNTIKSCSVVVLRREVLAQCGLFNEDITGTDDWDMWLRVARCSRIHCNPDALTLYRTHPNQLSKDGTVMRQGDVTVREYWLRWAKDERPEWTAWLRPRLAHALQRLAKCLMKEGNNAQAVIALRRAVAVWPWDIRSLLLLTLCWRKER